VGGLRSGEWVLALVSGGASGGPAASHVCVCMCVRGGERASQLGSKAARQLGGEATRQRQGARD